MQMARAFCGEAMRGQVGSHRPVRESILPRTLHCEPQTARLCSRDDIAEKSASLKTGHSMSLGVTQFFYVSDQPTSVRASSTASALRLTSDRTLPWPKRRSRVSDLMHSIAATSDTANHEMAEGSPG
jgi:hypothetical protein